MNFIGTLILFSLLAVLPTHTFSSITSPEPVLTDKLNLHLDWHKVRRLWIDSAHLHTEPEIFSYIQFLEKIERVGQIEKYNISLGENATQPNSTGSVSSPGISTNQTSTQNYVHILAGLMVKTLCDSLVPLRRTCDKKLEECPELQKNETEIRVSQWCNNVAERVEKEPFSIEIMKFLDLISNPGLLSENATFTSNSSNIVVEWSLKNPEIGILFEVTAYNVSYCPLNKPNEWSCYGKWKELTVEAKDAVLKTTIGNLEANRKYKVAVVTIFKNGMQASEKKYKYVRTKSVNSNGSVIASASHILCSTFSALLLMFFSSQQVFC